MAKAFGIITAAANRYVVQGLQEHRPISAFSFGGRYRMVDFPISNMSNSGIERIQVYASGNPRSLTEHLASGRDYNINSKRGKLQLLFHDEGALNRLYNTDIASFAENIDHIARSYEEYVVIAPSNIVYRQDFNALLNQHIESGADVTLLYQRINNAREICLGCNTLSLNRQKGVQGIGRNMGEKDSQNIFLDTYVMKRELLLELIDRAKKLSSMYRLSQMLSLSCDEYDVRGVQHKGFMAAITDLKSYYDTNLFLLDPACASSLFDPKWPIYTRTNDSCPTQYFKGSSVKNSLVSNGCEVYGSIEGSVVGRGVKIGKGSVVKNCVVLSYATIADGVHLENQVVDKWSKVIHAKELIAPAETPGYVKRSDTI